MKFLKFIPAVLTFCLIIGILIGYYYPLDLKIAFSFIVFIFVILVIAYFFSNKKIGNHFYFNAFAYLLFILIGIISISIKKDFKKENFYQNYLKKEKENSLYILIQKRLKPTTYHYKYQASILKINNHNAIGKVLLNISKDSLVNPLEIGNIYYTKTKFSPILTPKNPYSFNYKNYLNKKQIYQQLFVRPKELFWIKSNNSFNRISANIIHKINANLKKYSFNKDQLAIINALLLGQRQDISKDLITAYQDAGAIHILAVSGLHIGVLFGLLLLVLTPIKHLFKDKQKGKIARYAIAIFFLWLYAFLAGMSGSIARSATMFTALALSTLVNRKSNAINALFISAFVLLLLNPYYLLDVGFQLSYLAVFSIVFWNPIFTKLWQPKNKIIHLFWKIFTVSISAQIGILPLSLYYFHQFPALFFISGLVILPVLGVLLGLGFLILILAYFNFLPDFLAKLFSFFIEILNQFILFISKQETFIFKHLYFSVLLLFCSYVLIIAIYRLMDSFSYKKLIFLLLGVLVFQSVLIYEKHFRESEKAFIVFNQPKNTLIGLRNGKNLSIHFNLDSLTNNTALNNYFVGTGVSNIKKQAKINNYYTFNGHKILVIDSLGIYKINNLKPDIVLLKNSPKINVERMLNYVHPKQLVVDASNYTSYVKYYRKQAKKLACKFYNTKQNGAFILKR